MDKFANAWASVVHTYSPRQIELGGMVAVQILSFWIPSGLYVSLPWIAPAFSERHKIQPAPKQPTWADIRHCIAVVLRNNVVSMGLATLLNILGSDEVKRVRITSTLPPLAEVARDIVLCCVIREVLFYYAHRWLHQPRWYRTIHKTHHRFIAPVALAAQYAHPVEHIAANVLPVGLPPLLLGSHILTNWAFIALMLLETSTVHSGYDFYSGAAIMHDAHHEKFNLNYGVFGWMDWLHGTDGKKKCL